MTSLHRVVAGCLAAALACGAAHAADPPVAIAWQKDLKAAQRQAAATGKPMLLVFGADWCKFCKTYERETLGHPTMAGYVNREFVPVHLDFERDGEVAETLKVEALPCTVVLSPEADLLGRIVGNQAPKDLWEALEDAKDMQAKVRQTRFADRR